MHQPLHVAPEIRPPAAAVAVPRWVRIADAASLLMLTAWAVLLVGDGVRVDLGSVHISVRSAVRVAVWAAVVIVARHAIYVSPALPTRVIGWFRVQPWRRRLPFVLRVFASTRVPPILIGLLAVATIGLGPEVHFKMPFDSAWLNLPARWDAGWYADVAAIGYRWNYDPSVQQNVVFFPAFPMIAGLIARPLGVNVLYACWIVALAAFVWAMVLFTRLARMILDEAEAADSAWLLATYPFAVYFSAPYSESLFLLSMCGAFLAVEEQRFARAGAWGLLLGLTRPNGWLIALPLAIQAWVRADDESRRDTREWLRRGLAVGMPVIGVLLYTLYLHLQFGDGFAWYRGQAAWGRSYRGLDVLILDRVQYMWDYGLVTYLVDLPIDAMNFGAALLALFLIAPVTRRLGIAYGTLVAVIVLPPLLVGGTMSIGRMTSVLFPLFIWLAAVLPRDRRTGLMAAFATGQGFAAVLFFTWRPLF